MIEASAKDPPQGGPSPYRETTATLGELRASYVPQGRVLGIGYATVAVLVLLFGLDLYLDLANLGSLAAVREDVAKLGDSGLLGALLLASVLVPLTWALLRVRRIHRHQRVRFYEHGVELVSPKGVTQQCRYDEVVEITRVDLGRGLQELRIERTAGEPWVIPPFFETDVIAARLAVLQRRDQSLRGSPRRYA